MAFSVTPGQVINWNELNELLGQHGSRSGAKSIQELPPKALTDAEARAIIAAGGNPDAPQARVIRYWTDDDSYFDAVLEQPGQQTGDAVAGSGEGSTFRIVDYKPSQKFQAAQTKAATAAGQATNVYVGVNPSTGKPTQVTEYPDGRKTYDDTQVPASANPQPRVVPTNTTEPYIVIQQPDGAIATEKNPNYKGDAPKPGTNLHIESGGKHYIIPIDATGKAGAAQDLGLPAEAKPGSRSLVDGGDGQKYIVTIGADNTVTTTDTAGRPVPGGVPPKRDAGTIRYNPETGEYEQVRTDPATGRATVSAVPREGAGPAAPRQPAPSLPTIVVGQSQDALRTAYTQIQEEVDAGRRTAAWGENRRKEVFEAAQLAVNESHIIEQSRQANQTTAFNVANAQMGYGQSSLTNALKFTLDINDKLKPGSGTGGKMFAALFNMQMAMGMASGMYGMNVPQGSSVGGPRAPGQPPGASGAPSVPPPPRLSNVGDPAAVEADHQQSLARLAAGDAADAAAGPLGRAMTPSRGGPEQPLPIRSGVPVTSTPALPGGPAVPPVPLPQPAGVPGAASPAPMPATAPAPGFGDPGFRWGPPGGGEAQDPGFRWGPPGGGEQQDPGFFLDPRSSQAQPGRFAALDQLRATFAPQPAAPQIDPTTGGIGIPPALQRAQIAATPPWRLPPDQLEALVQQHGPETVFGWPGQNLLGMG